MAEHCDTNEGPCSCGAWHARMKASDAFDCVRKLKELARDLKLTRDSLIQQRALENGLRKETDTLAGIILDLEDAAIAVDCELENAYK